MRKKEETEKKVTILRTTFVRGDLLEVGATQTLPIDDAKDLIAIGKAIAADEITREHKTMISDNQALIAERLSRKSMHKNPIEGKVLARQQAELARQQAALDADRKAFEQEKQALAKTKAQG